MKRLGNVERKMFEILCFMMLACGILLAYIFFIGENPPATGVLASMIFSAVVGIVILFVWGERDERQ